MDFAAQDGGFCRRRWDGFQPLPPTGDSRKKKAVGEICACFRTPTPLLVGVCPTSETFAVDGSQPLPPIGDSRKKTVVGKFVPGSGTSTPLFVGDCPTSETFAPLTVISLSTRKSPAVGGALSLSPDGVSDPAEGARAQPAKRSRPRSKAGARSRASESGQGGGSGQFNPLTVISLSTRKSPAVGGALSLSPDGVSDPAEGARAQPAKRSRPRSKAGARSRASESGQGGGSGQFNPLIFLYLTFHFSMIVNSFN